jgi:hypothetical protein
LLRIIKLRKHKIPADILQTLTTYAQNEQTNKNNVSSGTGSIVHPSASSASSVSGAVLWSVDTKSSLLTSISDSSDRSRVHKLIRKLMNTYTLSSAPEYELMLSKCLSCHSNDYIHLFQLYLDSSYFRFSNKIFPNQRSNKIEFIKALLNLLQQTKYQNKIKIPKQFLQKYHEFVNNVETKNNKKNQSTDKDKAQGKQKAQATSTSGDQDQSPAQSQTNQI